MPTFKDLGTNIITQAASGIPGPLGDAITDKFGTKSLSFPSDVEGVGQRHFIRFNIFQQTGATFESPKNVTATAAGDFLSGLVGGAISDSYDGPAGSLVGGLATRVASSVISEAGIDTLAASAINGATSLFNEAVEGIATSVETTFGQLSEQAQRFQESVAEKVPIAEDALNGVGGFMGSIGGIAEEFTSAIPGFRKTEADIVLYMPFAIAETYAANWEGGEMGLVGAFEGAISKIASGVASGSTMEGMKQGLESVMEQFTMSNLKGASAEVGGAIAGQFLGNENITKKLLKNQGKAINPYWELFFTGVQPRTFTFDFSLTPKNPDEGDSIQKIIKAFKTYAAPPASVDGSRRYWGYPSFFEIEYWNSEKLHKLKPCALQSISVNYSGDGTNHTFYDGRPMKTDLSLTFMESELLTRQDMKQGF